MNKILAIIKLSVLGCFFAVMIGCGSTPEGANGDQATVPENPYLLNRQKVSHEAISRFEKANAAIEKKQWQEAEQQLSWLIENNPRLSGPYLDLALVYRQTQQLEKSADYFSKAIETNPTNLVAYNQYGIFLREQGDFQAAKEQYLQALAVWEPYPDTHRNLGVLNDLYLGNKEVALSHYYRYQELTSGQDRLVAAWIADLERQLTTVTKGD
jgi:Tfp pilus assembly protein PilF